MLFVLAVLQVQRILHKEIWLAFGTGKLFRYFSIHEIDWSLGPQKSQTLPVMHNVTGCAHRDVLCWKKLKKNAWGTWIVFPHVTIPENR